MPKVFFDTSGEVYVMKPMNTIKVYLGYAEELPRKEKQKPKRHGRETLRGKKRR